MKIRINLTKIALPIFSFLLFTNDSTKAQSLQNVLNENESKIKDEIVLVKTGKYKEAIIELEKKSVNFPDNPSIYYYLGKSYEKENNIIESIRNYNIATEVDPNYAKPYMAIALLKGKQNKLKETVKFLDKAILVDPNYAKAYSNRGVAKGALSNNEGAIEDFNKAIKLDPFITEAYVNRGITHELMGNIKLACSDWKSAKSLGNSKVSSWFNEQCKNIDFNEINLSEVNRDLLKEVKSLKTMIKNQKKTLDEVINSKSASSVLQEMQIGTIPNNKITFDNSNQDITENKSNSIEKARLKLNSLSPNLEEQTNNKNELNLPSLGVENKKVDEISSILFEKNSVTQAEISPVISEINFKKANITSIYEENPPNKLEKIPLTSSIDAKENNKEAFNIQIKEPNPTIVPISSGVKLSKIEPRSDKNIKFNDIVKSDSNYLKENQVNPKLPNSSNIEPTNNIQTLESAPLVSRANDIYPKYFDRRYSRLGSNQIISNDLYSNIGLFGLGFFMATTSLLLIDKLKGNQIPSKNLTLSNKSNSYPKMINEGIQSFNSNRQMDLDLKETTKIVEQTQLLIDSLNEQKLLIEKDIKILNLDLDFLKIKQSNLKVYCLSKYKNEIDHNNEYKSNSNLILKENSNLKFILNSENFNV